MPDEIAKLFDSVATRLSDRRAFRPLWRFLAAYFSFTDSARSWTECYDALRVVRALCGSDLHSDELRDINLLTKKIGGMLEGQDASEMKPLGEASVTAADHLPTLGGWSIALPGMKPSWSVEVYNLLAVSPESDLTLDQITGFISPDERGKIKAAFAACASDGTSFCLEVELLTIRVQHVWVRIVGIAERDKRGAIFRISGSFQEIAKTKLAEASRSENEERARATSRHLSKVLDSMLDVICTFDADGFFIQVNAACKKMWGYDPEELLGTHFLNLVHPEDLEKTKAVDAGIMSGDIVRNFENRYVRKDGTAVHILWSAWWSEADQSNFCVAHDVTEVRQAEAASKEMADRLQLAAKASKVGIWDWNIETGSIHWDQQMFALYGEDHVSSQAGFEIWHRHLHPEDKERAKAELDAAINGKAGANDYSFRIIVPAPDGEVRHIRGERLVLRNSTGQAVRMLGTNWDITAQVRREEVLRQKLEEEKVLRLQAAAGEKTKSEFLAMMSHEIRTPMHGILGFAEMLARSPMITLEDHDLAQTIVSSGEGLLRILNDILDFSRIEAGQFAIEKRGFSPQKLIHDIELLFRPQIQQKHLEFVLSLEKNVPVTLRGDAGRIRQILVNLLGNSLKFTERGSIRLDVGFQTEADHRNVFRCVVHDTGPGILPERIPFVFDAFTQADSSISRRHGGTGLGLTISRKLADLMGGTLQVDSQLGQGASFTLRLPLEVTAEVPAAQEPRGSVTSPMGSEFALQHPLLILVVDDDRVNRKLITEILSRLGYQPLIARNGLEALELFLIETPDCVFMDMQMPTMDGIEAAGRIRAAELGRSLPPTFISAVTANILPNDLERCLNAGMNAYLNKPFKVQAIADVLVEASNFRRGPKPR